MASWWVTSMNWCQALVTEVNEARPASETKSRTRKTISGGRRVSGSAPVDLFVIFGAQGIKESSCCRKHDCISAKADRWRMKQTEQTRGTWGMTSVHSALPTLVPDLPAQFPRLFPLSVSQHIVESLACSATVESHRPTSGISNSVRSNLPGSKSRWRPCQSPFYITQKRAPNQPSVETRILFRFVPFVSPVILFKNSVRSR